MPDESSDYSINEFPTCRRRPRTTFFMGAGFSAASIFEYPVSRNFFTKNCDFPHAMGSSKSRILFPANPEHREFKRLVQFIEDTWGSVESQDLEAVMADLHIRSHGIGRVWENIDWARLPTSRRYWDAAREYETLKYFIVARLADTDTLSGSCPMTQRFVQLVNEADSILSLNYDTLLEKHLNALGDSHQAQLVKQMLFTIGPMTTSWDGHTSGGFPVFENPKDGVFCKLHGSTDWISCPNESCTNHESIRSISDWAPSPIERRGMVQCHLCGEHPSVVIVPPTVAKNFDEYSRIRLLWLQAFHALTASNRWVFIGLSFAATDYHLSSLIQAALRAKLIQKGPDSDFQISFTGRDIDGSRQTADRFKEKMVQRSISIALAPKGHIDRRISIFDGVDTLLDALEQGD